MIEAKDLREHGMARHGHKGPARPVGLRGGAAALNALGVGWAVDGQLLTPVELGEGHCATCFAEGGEDGGRGLCAPGLGTTGLRPLP